MCNLRSKLHLVQSVSISDDNDKVAHSILWLTLSCFLSSGLRESTYLQFNKAPAILVCFSICFLQLFLLFEGWGIKAQLESCHFSCRNLYHLNCSTWSFNTLKSRLFSVEKVLEQEPHVVQVV